MNHQAHPPIRQPVETALYFPYIQVPQTPWFTQVLLYWDKAAAIVPEEVEGDRSGLPPYMRELNDVGLLDFVRPGQTLGNQRREQFEAGFIAVVERGMGPSPQRSQTYTQVHVDKMGSDLFFELRRLGLASKNDAARWNWWQVEARTADVYMGYLASAMCEAQEGMLPVTDEMDALNTLGPDSRGFRANLATSTIRRALPAPSGPVPPRELMKFKEKNGDQLRQCRIHLVSCARNSMKI